MQDKTRQIFRVQIDQLGIPDNIILWCARLRDVQ